MNQGEGSGNGPARSEKRELSHSCLSARTEHLLQLIFSELDVGDLLLSLPAYSMDGTFMTGSSILSCLRWLS